MLSRKSILVFLLIGFGLASPTRNTNVGYGPLPPGSSVDARKSIEIFDSGYAERETRAVLVKYAQAEKYLSGIGLNPLTDDIIKLADRYSPSIGVPTSPSSNTESTTVSSPSPSNADTRRPSTDGKAREEAGIADSHDSDDCQAAGWMGDDDGQDEMTSFNTASSDLSSESHSSFQTTATGSGPQWPLQDEVSGALDVLYYGPLYVGTPSQGFTVDFDTGSADLWLPANCHSCHGRQFEAGRSSTYRPTNQDVSITYGTGKVSGKVVRDVVSAGGLTVSSQAFGSINNKSDEFNKQPNDGLIGMAFGTIAQSRQPTFFENLIKERKLAAPLFSIHLSRHEERASSVCLGCIDPKWTAGPVKWFPVVSKTYWAINLDGMWANGVKAPVNLTAAIDTGTSLIYVPPALASAFYSLLPGSKRANRYGPGFWTVPCFSVKQIELSFGGHRFAINASDFYLGRVSASSTDCVGGVLSMGNGLPSNLAIIGDEFLKSWYSTYDYGNGARVGFWPDANNE